MNTNMKCLSFLKIIPVSDGDPTGWSSDNLVVCSNEGLCSFGTAMETSPLSAEKYFFTPKFCLNSQYMRQRTLLIFESDGSFN